MSADIPSNIPPNIPSDILCEIVARVDPLEWKDMNTTFPELNWAEVVRLAKIPNLTELFFRAIKLGHSFLVHTLLEHAKVDPSIQNGESIMLAIIYGKIDILQLLLADPRVDPCAQDSSAIILACNSTNINILNLLLGNPRTKITKEVFEFSNIFCEEDVKDIIRPYYKPDLEE